MSTLDVNGQTYAVDEAPETAVDLIRDRLGLTGTKFVCGAGVCGACTIGVDGEPLVSCLLPAAALDGRRVTTVEGLAAHPVTRAFAAQNALQCGFCTPGFVVEAAAFHDRWRAAHGAEAPPDAQIAAALAGHLCRCGAYPEIYSAVRLACAGAYDAPGEPAGPRVEAGAKVTGRARFTVDQRYPGQLVGLILRSTEPHATITALDLAPALAVPGVRAATDLAPADRVVRYLGQEVAAVAAVDRASAEAGLRAIAVRYEPLPAVIGMAAARAERAPKVYATGKRQPPNAGEGMLTPTPWKGNLHGPTSAFSVGRRAARDRLDTARRAGDPLLVELSLRAGAQSHTSFEPHAAVARWTDGSLEVYLSTQAVSHLAHEIADRFDLPADRVRVIAEHVGGAFGSKLTLRSETVAAIRLARDAAAPVAVVLDRQEELSYTGYRAAVDLEIALLADRDANLRALRLTAHADSGIAVGSTVAGLARLIYPTDAKDLVDYDVVTNAAPGSPFRGPGGPPACFALEQAVDEVAGRLGYDPVELRRRWDPEPGRQRLYAWAAGLPAWQDRAALPRTGRFRRGIGVAAANWMYWWESGCQVRLGVEHGRLVVSAAVQDMGTGSRTVLARTVAEEFGLRPDEVTVRVGDSALPRGPRSGGSRATATIAPAALEAASRLRKLLADRGLTLADAHGLAVTAGRPADDGVLGRQAPAPFAGSGFAGAGLHWMLRLFGGLRTGRGYTGAVHIAEVEVDTRLGRTRVLRYHAGVTVGRFAAPELAQAQVRGAVVQGIGYALYEHREIDPHTGLVLSAGLEDYRIPGIADIGEIVVHADPDGFEHVPGGGVGLGEVATLPVAAAVANAVHDATGVRLTELPIQPDRLLAALTQAGTS